MRRRAGQPGQLGVPADERLRRQRGKVGRLALGTRRPGAGDLAEAGALGKHEVEGRVLGEDVRLHLAQRGARVDAELVGQGRAGPAEGGEGVALPAAAVEAEGQQPPALLAQRILAGEGFEVGHGLGVQAESQPRVGVPLARHQAQLGEPAHLGLGPLLLGEVGVGGAAPEPERGLKAQARRLGVVVVEVLARRPDHGLEAQGVDLFGRGAQGVPGGDGDEQPVGAAARPAGLEHAAQAGDVDLEPRLGALGTLVGPQVEQQRIHGHDLAACDE